MKSGHFSSHDVRANDALAGYQMTTAANDKTQRHLMAQEAYDRNLAIQALQHGIGASFKTIVGYPDQMIEILEGMGLSPSASEGLRWAKRERAKGVLPKTRIQPVVVVADKNKNKAPLVRFSVKRRGKEKNLCQMLGTCKVKQWAKAAGILEIADSISVCGTTIDLRAKDAKSLTFSDLSLLFGAALPTVHVVPRAGQ
jgi:hypothetical protein